MTRKLDFIRRLIVDLQRAEGARGELPSVEFGRDDVRTALAPAADHMSTLAAMREQTLTVVVPELTASFDADEQRLDPFELFNREGRAGAPAGLGVGLAVVSRSAELHGGRVEGHSAGPLAGSVLTVRLPMRQS